MRESDKLVLHIDVDAFFASVEQLLIPALRSRPVIVGSGCIASCSYEARRFGLHAGMSLREAMKLCPDAVVLRGQYQTYRCFAEHIWRVCRRYVAELETYLDEAYGDAAGMERLHGDPPTLGRKLRQAILDEVRLPVSIGLAGNRMLAKIASHQAKPPRKIGAGSDESSRNMGTGTSSKTPPSQSLSPFSHSQGVVWIPPDRQEEFLAGLPIESIPGVGHKTAELLGDMSIRTVRDLRALSRESLRAMFGLRGEVLYERCRGRDADALCPAAIRMPKTPKIPKSISRETTFHQPQDDPKKIQGMLYYLLERAMRAMRKLDLLAGAVELNIRYDDWKDYNQSRALAEPAADDAEVFDAVLGLLERLHHRRVALRHVGVMLSCFRPKGSRAALLEPRRCARRRELYGAIDSIRQRWGHAAIVAGKSIELVGDLQQNDYGFVLRTPSLTK